MGLEFVKRLTTEELVELVNLSTLAADETEWARTPHVTTEKATNVMVTEVPKDKNIKGKDYLKIDSFNLEASQQIGLLMTYNINDFEMESCAFGKHTVRYDTVIRMYLARLFGEEYIDAYQMYASTCLDEEVEKLRKESKEKPIIRTRDIEP